MAVAAVCRLPSRSRPGHATTLFIAKAALSPDACRGHSIEPCWDRDRQPVGIEQHLFAIEAQPVLWSERPMGTVGVDLTGADAGHQHVPVVPSAVSVRREGDDARGLVRIGVREQEQLEQGRIAREHAEIYAFTRNGCAQWRAQAIPHALVTHFAPLPSVTISARTFNCSRLPGRSLGRQDDASFARARWKVTPTCRMQRAQRGSIERKYHGQGVIRQQTPNGKPVVGSVDRGGDPCRFFALEPGKGTVIATWTSEQAASLNRTPAGSGCKQDNAPAHARQIASTCSARLALDAPARRLKKEN